MSGRGQLSSLDLTPEEGQDAIRWALGELNKRERTAEDIRFELNDKLAVVGCPPISRSAFNRASIKFAARARRLAERQQIYASIAASLTPEAIGKTDLVLAEFLKTLVDEMLDDTLTPKNAMELARAYRDILAGQKLSGDLRRAAEAEFADKASAAIDSVAERKGLSADVVETIKAQVLGVER